MNFNTKNRQSLVFIAFLLYFLPVFIFSIYALGALPLKQGWFTWSFGLLLVTMGTLVFWFFLQGWEEGLLEQKSELIEESLLVEKKVEEIEKINSQDFSEISIKNESLNVLENKQKQLLKELDEKNALYIVLEESYRQLQLKHKKMVQEFTEHKFLAEERLKQKHLQIAELQQAVENQRNEMETRQQQVSQLDTKVHDLSHEIKTLLNLDPEEKNHFSPLSKKKNGAVPLQPFSQTSFQNPEGLCVTSDEVRSGVAEATYLLRKCVEAAQKMTGANYLAKETSRYREFSSSYYAIDQRRLFDEFREETGAMILVFSPKEHKPLFVNPRCKSILGWLPEKVMSDFHGIIHESANEWKKGIGQLKGASETHLRLLAKTKEGKEVLLDCLLASVPHGLFRGYVIGVCYPN